MRNTESCLRSLKYFYNSQNALVVKDLKFTKDLSIKKHEIEANHPNIKIDISSWENTSTISNGDEEVYCSILTKILHCNTITSNLFKNNMKNPINFHNSFDPTLHKLSYTNNERNHYENGYNHQQIYEPGPNSLTYGNHFQVNSTTQFNNIPLETNSNPGIRVQRPVRKTSIQFSKSTTPKLKFETNHKPIVENANIAQSNSLPPPPELPDAPPLVVDNNDQFANMPAPPSLSLDSPPNSNDGQASIQLRHFSFVGETQAENVDDEGPAFNPTAISNFLHHEIMPARKQKNMFYDKRKKDNFVPPLTYKMLLEMITTDERKAEIRAIYPMLKCDELLSLDSYKRGLNETKSQIPKKLKQNQVPTRILSHPGRMKKIKFTKDEIAQISIDKSEMQSIRNILGFENSTVIKSIIFKPIYNEKK